MSTVFFIAAVPGPKKQLNRPACTSDDKPRLKSIDEMQIPRRKMQLMKMSVEEAENIALSAFSYITGEPERMNRFLTISGLRLDTMRIAAESAGFFAGILDYLASDEALLIGFSEQMNMKPERVMQAHWALSPSEFE
jgi:hypothetical protein